MRQSHSAASCRQREESAALDLAVASQVSISNLNHVSLNAFSISIPPTITINGDWYGTSCCISPLRGRLVSGMTILCKDDAVKATLLTCTFCTIPACRGDLYKDPEFNMAGKQMGWTMEPIGAHAVGFSIHFTMGVPPRPVAVILSNFPAKVEERVGVCTWRCVCPSGVWIKWR